MAQPFKHPSTGVYYIRRKVPAPLQSQLGREYKRSLKTRDPNEAKGRFVREWTLSEDLFARAWAQQRGEEVLSHRDMAILAQRWAASEIAKMEVAGDYKEWLTYGSSTWGFGDLYESERPLVTFREAFEDDDIAVEQRAYTLNLAEQVLRSAGFPMPLAESPKLDLLRREFQEAWLTVSDVALKRLRGDWARSDTLSGEPISLEVKKHGTAAGKSLLEVFEDYAQDRRLTDGDSRSVRKSIDAYRGLMSEFIEICGTHPIQSLSRDVIRHYRTELARLPSKGKGIRGLSVAERIAKAKAEGLPLAHDATIRNKLRAVSAVCSYAVRMGLIPENPVIASGQGRAAAKAAAKSAEKRSHRNYYTAAELAQIFSSPVFTDGVSSWPMKFGAAWYWLPLLMYYTGARREEVAQLKVSDIKRHEPHGPYISILNDDEADGERGVKNAGSRRGIPLHPHLLELGFLRYVDRLDPSGQVFPLLVPDAKGFFGALFGRYWGNYLRDTVRLVSPASPSHGFRHTFKTLCREVAIPEDVHDALTGHVGASKVARRYGEMPLARLAKEIHRFPRINESVVLIY